MPKPKTSRWSDGRTPLDALPADERLAHEIVTTYGDLAPSVQRIMAAPLDESERHHALTLFRDSLGSTGDPHRDPRVAIDAARPAQPEA